MKQTAVEYTIQEIEKLAGIKISRDEDCIQIAKEMEKQQIIDFAIWFNYTNTEYLSYKQIIEQYYNETFKQQ